MGADAPSLSRRNRGRNGGFNMLNETLARSLIEQLGECTDYCIHLINKAGYIVASSDPKRVGAFHETAFRMLQEIIPVLDVGKQGARFGAEPGSNLLFCCQKKPVGVISICGDAEAIRPVAPVIRKSVELMLECELGKMHRLHGKTTREQLIHDLLYCSMEPEKQAEVLEFFDSLGYRRELPRFPVVFSVRSQLTPEQLLETCKELLPLSAQDLLGVDRKGHLVLLLSYPEPLDGFFERYRFYVETAVKEFCTWCSCRSLPVCVFVGPMQVNPASYQYGYEKALWLKENRKEPECGIVYFYDCVGEYLKSLLPLRELHQIFEAFSACYSKEFTKLLMEHMDVLQQNNYNFQQSSQQLYIHKNTLAFRLNKIREQLGADPIQNLKDRELVEYLCYYLQQAARRQNFS